jgi:N-acetylglucosaminyldiphosphoundecaprenol N-acetyl-beta-D-mannosaminyltransferase
LLALGSPRQEKWFARNKERLAHVKLVQAVGGTLDTIGGSVKRAPRLWQQCHLEWLYRLLAEPTRMGRQRVLPVFVWRVLKEWVKNRVGFRQPSVPRRLDARRQ